MDQYAVFGNPIAHSKSPRIHGLFARQTGQDIEYRARLVSKDGFAAALRDFRACGGKGLNITLPFKQEAWEQMDRCQRRAHRARAVNTISIQPDGTCQGDNTDGVGLVRDLTVNQGFSLTGARVLILGAGGATRGVLQPFLEQRPQLLVIANRTRDKAVTLADDFSTTGDVEGCGFPELAGRRFDLLVNATAASLTGEVPPLPENSLADGAWAYDMVYGSEPTAFQRWCQERGAARVLDGLGMLVEQAAESFSIWRGVRPDTAEVIAALRADR